MKVLKRRNLIFFRTFSVTSFMLICVITVIFAMAYVVTVIEKNAFGRTLEYLTFDSEGFTVLGHTFNFPLVAVVEKTESLVNKYSLGIIKLLGMAVNTVEELIIKIFQMF